MVAFGLLTPRFVMLVLWIFTDYLSTAFGGWFWATLGFFVLPTTTIAYAIAQNEFSTPMGGIKATGIVVIVLGVLVDLGLFGAGARGRGIGRRSSDNL